VSIAQLSWKEIFTDAVLQKHISKALENNLDIRIALQNIASAEAYLKQSKQRMLLHFCRARIYI
jgi:outer membrane protein TolC